MSGLAARLSHALTPVGFRKAQSGAPYRVGTVEHRVPALDWSGAPPYLLHPRVLADMAALLKQLDRIFRGEGIDYWIATGTLLGAVRHGGFIPWDDDTDVNMLLSDVPRLLALKRRFTDVGLLLRKGEGGYKLGYSRAISHPYIDIIIVERRDERFDLCYPLDDAGKPTWKKAAQWPGECFACDTVYPLRDMPFEDFTVRAPGTAEALVRQTYGESALTAVRGTKRFPWLDNHRTDALLLSLGVIKG